jgi:hypothetical protein
MRIVAVTSQWGNSERGGAVWMSSDAGRTWMTSIIDAGTLPSMPYYEMLSGLSVAMLGDAKRVVSAFERTWWGRTLLVQSSDFGQSWQAEEFDIQMVEVACSSTCSRLAVVQEFENSVGKTNIVHVRHAPGAAIQRSSLRLPLSVSEYESWQSVKLAMSTCNDA